MYIITSIESNYITIRYNIYTGTGLFTIIFIIFSKLYFDTISCARGNADRDRRDFASAGPTKKKKKLGQIMKFFVHYREL